MVLDQELQTQDSQISPGPAYALRQSQDRVYAVIILPSPNFLDKLPESIKQQIFSYFAYEHAAVHGKTKLHPLNQLALVSRGFHRSIESMCTHLNRLHLDRAMLKKKNAQPPADAGIAPSTAVSPGAPSNSTATVISTSSGETQQPTSTPAAAPKVPIQAFPRRAIYGEATQRAKWLHIMRHRCVFCLKNQPTKQVPNGPCPKRVGNFNNRVIVCEPCEGRVWPDPISWAHAKKDYGIEDRHLLWPPFVLQKGWMLTEFDRRSSYNSDEDIRHRPSTSSRQFESHTVLLKGEVEHLAQLIKNTGQSWGRSYWE